MASSDSVSGFNLIKHPALPSDAIYEIHGYLSLVDMLSYIRSMGRYGQQMALYGTETLFATDDGTIRGLTVKNILIQLGRIRPEFLVIKLPNSQYSIQRLLQHAPIAASFSHAFNAFERACLNFRDTDLIEDTFNALRQVTNLTVAEKRQLIDFIVKNSHRILISPSKISSYLAHTNALDDATPQQLSDLLSLATSQANNWRAPSRQLLNSLIATLSRTIGDDAATRFNEIHPDVLGGTLLSLLGNIDSLDGYRSLIAAIPSQLIDVAHLGKIISKLTTHSKTAQTDFSSLAHLLNGNEVQTEIGGMEKRELEGLAVKIIGTKNPELFRAFCNAVGQDRFSDIRRQIQLSIDCASIYHYEPTYVALLQTAMNNDGQFGPAE